MMIQKHKMLKTDYQIVLASNSPRRKELLAGLDVPFTVKVVEGIDESYPADLPVMDIAQYIATKKAAAYQGDMKDNELVITADTIVVLGGDVLNEKDQYLYANWWYNSDDALSQTENIHRSCDEAVRYVKSLSAPQEKHYIAVLTNRETRAGALFA